MRPTFIVIGAEKAATTSICAQLEQHPDVFVTDPKEPGFFSAHYDRGWGWYERLFDGAGECRAAGEGTVRYSQATLYPGVPERIASDLPDVRLIYVTRHPLDRVESMWIQWRSMGHEGASDDFCRSLQESPGMLDASRYWFQISAYRERFADEQILVLFFEEYRRDPAATLRRCFEHIGVDPDAPIPDLEARNESVGKLVDGPVAGVLRRVPLMSRVRDAMPLAIRDGVRRALKKPVQGRPVWDESTRLWAIERVAEDCARFLEHYGKPADYWNLGATPESAR
ncbi:MAG: sulfotransferase [Phycisphaeraceae bacterium]|nr:MAG: sulfotransferase [Phycisphaeraceae bacterium]